MTATEPAIEPAPASAPLDRLVPVLRRLARHWPILAVVAVAFLVRFLAVTQWLPTCTDEQLRARPAPGECYYVGGDAYYYRSMALNLVEGNGFQIRSYAGELAQVADHPPGFVLFLAGVTELGVESVAGHRMAMALLGTFGCGLVALLGRRLNPRAPNATALVAGGIAAVYPGFWMSDTLYLSESLYVPLFALTLLGAVRFWRRPDWTGALLTGAAAGGVWLTRGEGAVFLGILSIAAVLLLRTIPFWRRVVLCAGACAVCIGMMLPWAAYNLNRFDEPVYIATTGTAFALNSCDETWEGPAAGWYSFRCLSQASQEVIAEQGRLTDSGLRAKGTEYIRSHLGRLPVVMAIRVARVYEVYEREDTMARNIGAEGRPAAWVENQRLLYELLVLPGLFGLWVLFKRRQPVIPLVAAICTATVGVAGTFAIYRYRLAADLALFTAGSVGLVTLAQFLLPGLLALTGRGGAEPPPALADLLTPDDETPAAPAEDAEADSRDGERGEGEGEAADGDEPSVPTVAPAASTAALARAGAAAKVAAAKAPEADGAAPKDAEPTPNEPKGAEPKASKGAEPKKEAPSKEPVGAGAGPLLRTEGARLLELIGLWALAVVQPVLEVFGKAGEELVARRVSAPDLISFALVLAVIPPLVLLGLTAAGRLVAPKVELIAHRVVLALLVGSVGVQAVGTKLDTPLPMLVGVIVAGGAAYLFFRYDAARVWARYLSPAAAAFVALFLFSSGATPIVLDTTEIKGSGVPIPSPVPVVMVVFDELPLTSLLDGKGGIDAGLYPNFAGLQRESTWFRLNSTPAAGTNWAVPAIMTGNYPGTIASPIAGVYKNSLFSFLGGNYVMDVQEVVTSLCDPSLCTPYQPRAAGESSNLYSRAADVWMRRATSGPSGGNDAGAQGKGDPNGLFYLPPDMHDASRIQDFIAGLRASRSPTFHFAHFILPHLPFEFTPTGRACSDGRPQYPIGANQWLGSWVSSWGGISARSRHLLQLQYLDAWVGEMVKELKASGLWDSAVVVFTADHGLNFAPGQLRAFTDENWHNLLYTPLFVRGPGLTPGTVDDRNANVMDIVPTIAAMLGTKLPYDTVGKSLLGPPDPSTVKRAIHNPKDSVAPTGPFVDFNATEGRARILKAAAAPGDPADPLRVFRIGPFAPLVGKQVAALPAGAPVTMRATVEAPGLTREFRSADREIACFVEGTLDDAAPHNVAIALNGTVLAVSPTGIDEQGPSFFAALPETSFVEGTNTITLYSVEGTPDRPILHPLSS